MPQPTPIYYAIWAMLHCDIMREPIRERLEKRVMVADGAMGTMLYSNGVPFSRCFDELNLSMPHLVKEVHLGYAKAGADIIETNTFGASRARLEKHGLAGKVREINLAGAHLAREVAGEDLYVAGAVGPLGLLLEPLSPVSVEDARAIFREQIEALAEGGVDLIVLETMVDVTEARQALLAARDTTPLPVVVQMTLQEDGDTPTGTSAEDFARQLDEWDADVIGVNCSMGPAGVLEALERIAKVTARKLSAQPNAGLPRTVDGRSIYLCSPDYMADYARRFMEGGARLLGGCCGTTPEHIRAIKKVVRASSPSRRSVVVEAGLSREVSVSPVAVEKRSGLARKLAGNQFPVLVEMLPPKGNDASREIEGAEYLHRQNIDGLSVPDGLGGTARMGALSLAVLLQQRSGAEVILHYSCRGRDVLTIQSDLLGASALGISNIVATTGEPSQLPAHSGALPISDVDSIGLVNVMNNLNRGLDAAGNPLGTQTAFLIGVRVNPVAVDLDEEVRRLEYKVKAGANFALAQPLFEVRQLVRFLKHLREANIPPIPVLAGISTLTSYRNAEFLNNEVPGMSVPRSILDRMRKADTGEQARIEGLKIAQELLHQVRSLVQGAHISAPFGRYALAAEVAEALTQNSELGSRN
ncbi:MAG: bifunctional homocysteine S-methyltransferase/methylenetetrahydrofolate reductase [Terriglobia bacterium]